jgi:hypothetical protein
MRPFGRKDSEETHGFRPIARLQAKAPLRTLVVDVCGSLEESLGLVPSILFDKSLFRIDLGFRNRSFSSFS